MKAQEFLNYVAKSKAPNTAKFLLFYLCHYSLEMVVLIVESKPLCGLS